MASLGDELTQQVLDDYESAPIDDRLRATLGFLKKMTLEHEALTADDARAVLATGVTREAERGGELIAEDLDHMNGARRSHGGGR